MKLLDPESAMVSLAVQMYRDHAPDHQGWCPVCRTTWCRVWRHCSAVIEAAGIDPRTVGQAPAAAIVEPTVLLPVLRLPQRTRGASIPEQLRRSTSWRSWWVR
jgi:hypothetical protein